MSTSTDTIEQLATREYKYGFETEVETDTFAPGLDEDVVRRLSAIKDEPEWLLEFRLKSYRAWLEMREPTWHNLKIEPIRLPGDQLLLGAEEEARAQEPGRSRSRSAQDVREARHSARRAEAAGRRRRRRRVRQRLGGDDVPREAGGARHHLLLVLGSGAAPSRAGAQVSRLGRAVHRQLLRDAQLGGLQRRLVRLRARRACAARWSCRPTSASTRRTPASSSGR